MLKNLLRDQLGQSLIEVLAGVAVAVVVVGALVGLGVSSIRQSNLAKNKELAGRIANNLVEQLRAFRDESGVDSLPDVDTDCTLINVGGLSIYVGGEDAPITLCDFQPYSPDPTFSYKITSLNLSPNIAAGSRLLLIEVRFSTSSGEEIVPASVIFSSWRER